MKNDIHFSQCEEQPDENSCICEELKAQEYDAMIDIQIREALNL
jgi:hypothetical protein